MSFPALLQIVILTCVFTAGWVIGFYPSSGERKWQRRYRDEQGFYAQFRAQADRLNLEKTQRITALEAELAALRQPLGVSVRGTDATEPVPEVHRAATMTSPEPPMADAIAEPDDDVSHEAPNAIMPLPNGPVSEATDVVASANAPAPAAPEAEPVAGTMTDDGMSQIGTEPVTAIVAALPLATDMNPLPPGDAAADELPELTQIRGIDADLAAQLHALDVDKIEDIERLSAEREKLIEDRLNLAPGQIAYDQWRLQAALLGSGAEAPDADPVAERAGPVSA